MKQRLLTLIIFVLFVVPVIGYTNVSVEDFSKGAQYSDVKISPTGRYLSFVSNETGKRVLAIFDRKENKLANVVTFPQNSEVGSYYWVNEERIVIEKNYRHGWLDYPVYYGELFGIDADGSNPRYLVGYKGEQQTGSRISKATPLLGTSYVLDPLINDEDNMLIVTYPWNGADDKYVDVYRVDIKRGKRKKITKAPLRNARYLTDHQGNVRAATSSDYTSPEIAVRDLEEKEWRKVDVSQYGFVSLALINFDASGKFVYASGSVNGKPDGLYKLSLETGKVELIHQDNTVDPSRIWVDDATKELFAIEYEPDYPSYVFIDSNAKMAKRLKGFIGALEGEQVQIVSSSRDGEINIVRAISDRNPGDYYIYNAKENQFVRLFAARAWLNKNSMQKSQPISFKSRDGLTITGYLKLPKANGNTKPPLVVMPHGGPHGPRDWWEFDPEAQLLASRGYAVLKVNFRGSGGFGPGFEWAGHRKWGSEIQYDIIDGVKYVVDQGLVDKDRMCTMGSSFGGYSALQSSIIEPDMFKCAIGVMGVYDLPLMFDEGDVSERSSGQAYLKEVLGDDIKQLKAFSPSYNISKLKAPVLIVHGGEDERAPIEQAESLIKALKAAEHPFEYQLLDNEGHGFYKPEHRAKYYKNVLAFLEKHLAL